MNEGPSVGLEDMGAGPPAKVKVFAPNGDTVERTCWLGMRKIPGTSVPAEVFLLYSDSSVEVLNKRVVVQNLETGQVIYNPRWAPRFYQGTEFLTTREIQWLKNNPHWPGILELEDNPVEEEDQDGLYA